MSKSIGNNGYFATPSIHYMILVIIGMSVLGVFAFTDIDYRIIISNREKSDLLFLLLSKLQELAYFLFQTQTNLRVLFFLAVGIHSLESLVAMKLAIDLNCNRKQTILWMIQTLLFGGFSLRLLIQKYYQDKKDY